VLAPQSVRGIKTKSQHFPPCGARVFPIPQRMVCNFDKMSPSSFRFLFDVSAPHRTDTLTLIGSVQAFFPLMLWQEPSCESRLRLSCRPPALLFLRRPRVVTEDQVWRFFSSPFASPKRHATVSLFGFLATRPLRLFPPRPSFFYNLLWLLLPC